VDDDIETFIVFENNLEITPQQLVWAGCRGIIAAGYSEPEFFL